MKVTGIVLAGGEGRRMQAITHGKSKALLEFNGVPAILHLVSWLMAYCDEIIIAAGHNSADISALFNQEVWRMRGVRVVGEAVPLGTGGAIRLAAEWASNDVTFVCNADTVVSGVDVAGIVAAHRANGAEITAVLTKNEDETVQNRGAVTISRGLVLGFDEGRGDQRIHHGNASSTGCYVMNTSYVMRHFPGRLPASRQEVSLERELLPLFSAMGSMRAVVIESSLFIDFGTPKWYEVLKDRERVIFPTRVCGKRF
jgi:mannose-1-phosphate guanylyltransferase